MTELDEQRTERLARLRERRADTPAADGASLPANPIGPTSAANAPLPVSSPSFASPSDRSATSELPAAQTGVGRSRRRPSPAATAKIVTVGASTTAVLGLVASYGLADRVPSANQVTTPGAATAESSGGSVSAPEPAATIASPADQTSDTPPPQIVVVVIDGTTGRPITTVDASALDDPARNHQVSTEPAPVASEAAPVATSAPTPQPPAPPVAIDLAVPAPAPAAPAPAPAPVQATTSGS